MIPVWYRNSKDKWIAAWMLSTSPHGRDSDRVLIAYQDDPNPNWNYPPGSLEVTAVYYHQIRLRRTVIPLLEAKDGG